MPENINYISKVEISNLWNRFNIEWNLNSDINILAGINGSGKTTIIGLMLLAMGRGYSSEMVSSEIEFDTTIVTFNNGNQYIIHKNNPITLDKFVDNYIETLAQIKIDIVSTFDTFLQTNESVRKLSDDNVKTELDWEIYQLQKKYINYQLNISKRKDFILETANDIKEELKRIRQPHIDFLNMIDNLFKETGKSINREKNEINFVTEDGKEISPYQLSSGEKQLLLILLKVLVQDNKPSILFMDEPELSLHIDWQKKLIQYIRELNPNVQIIIATHSPAVIMEGWLDKVTEVSDITKKTQAVLNLKNDDTQR